MRRLAGLLAALLALPLLAGAAQPSPSPRAPGPNEALVVFYRTAQPYGGAQPLFVDVERARPVKLGMAEHTFLYMPAGQVQMGPRFPDRLSARATHSPATFTLQPGRVHYFRLSAGLEVAQQYPAQLRSTLTLEEMSPAAARVEMDNPEGGSRYRPPERSYARLGARAE